MARNAINDHCEFKIGLKRTIEPIFSSNGHTTMHHTPLLHANRAQIARQLQCDFCNFELRSRILGFLWRAHAVIARDCVHVRLRGSTLTADRDWTTKSEKTFG
jgi:hypothetical protein